MTSNRKLWDNKKKERKGVQVSVWNYVAQQTQRGRLSIEQHLKPFNLPCSEELTPRFAPLSLATVAELVERYSNNCARFSN